MRILIAHNRYQQIGGEDHVVAAETEMLRTDGHKVYRLDTDNDHIQDTVTRISTSVRFFYSPAQRRRMASAIVEAQPDIVHVHNFFPTFSPSVFLACSEANIPVIHTLHNYRMLCSKATLFRNGAVCEECPSGKSFFPAIKHACYHSSPIGSAIVGAGFSLHTRLGTWSRHVSAFIALTHFAAAKLREDVLPKEKIFIKPNFAVDSGESEPTDNFAIFAGRLSPEKGIQTLIEADRRGLLCTDVLIVGDGPLRGAIVEAASRQGSRLIFKGHQSHAETLQYMRQAQALLIPSLWFEGFPLVIVEAFSLGLPVIGSRIGGIAEIIGDGETGMLFKTGDPVAMASSLRLFMNRPELSSRMRKEARRTYLAKYTEASNLSQLLTIYDWAIGNQAERQASLLN